MLDEYIKIHNGYPSDMTDEEWVDIVQRMSKTFKMQMRLQLNLQILMLKNILKL